MILCNMSSWFLHLWPINVKVEKQRAESKAEIDQLTAEEKEIESRIDTSLELLVDGRVPKERVIIKMQEDEKRLRDLQGKIIQVEEIKVPKVEDLEIFRSQLRKQVEGELDIEAKKSILNSFIKKWRWIKTDFWRSTLVSTPVIPRTRSVPDTSFKLLVRAKFVISQILSSHFEYKLKYFQLNKIVIQTDRWLFE